MSQEKKNVSIPAELYDDIDQRVKETEFNSVEEYVTFVLEEVLKDDEDDEEIAFSPEDEEEVKKRLRALGYLD